MKFHIVMTNIITVNQYITERMHIDTKNATGKFSRCCREIMKNFAHS